jgi:hypothetical protein
VIRALLLSGTSGDGEIAALRLSGARVSGLLNLQYATIEHAIRLDLTGAPVQPRRSGPEGQQLQDRRAVVARCRADRGPGEPAPVD